MKGGKGTSLIYSRKKKKSLFLLPRRERKRGRNRCKGEKRGRIPALFPFLSSSFSPDRRGGGKKREKKEWGRAGPDIFFPSSFPGKKARGGKLEKKKREEEGRPGGFPLIPSFLPDRKRKKKRRRKLGRKVHAAVIRHGEKKKRRVGRKGRAAVFPIYLAGREKGRGGNREEEKVHYFLPKYAPGRGKKKKRRGVKGKPRCCPNRKGRRKAISSKEAESAPLPAEKKNRGLLGGGEGGRERSHLLSFFLPARKKEEKRKKRKNLDPSLPLEKEGRGGESLGGRGNIVLHSHSFFGQGRGEKKGETGRGRGSVLPIFHHFSRSRGGGRKAKGEKKKSLLNGKEGYSSLFPFL